MDSDATNLLDLARQFPDDASARAYLESIRWPNGPVCPHCGTVNHAGKIAENHAKKIRAGLWQCLNRDCYKTFTVTIGSVMEASKIPLAKWLIAWHLVAASKKGIAALELQRLLGLGSYRSAWFLAMRIRASLDGPGPVDGSESVRRLFQRGVAGTWHTVSAKYRGRYMVEMGYRFARRELTDGGILRSGLATMGGKRLRLVDLKVAR